MRTPGAALLALMFVCGAAVLGAQRGGGNAADAVLDMLVWGVPATAGDREYAEPLATEVREYLQRSQAYRSTRTVPSSGEARLVNAARVRYERRLVAATTHPDAVRLAVEYVNELGPCYEWEGMSECPEREALFADTYQSEHPNGPFANYLPLLAAHRWLCAAELLEFEKKVPQTREARRKYNARLATARESKSVMVRTAADRLAARASCFATR